MIGVAKALWWVFSFRLKSRERLEAENLALRHQLNVLCRRAPRRLRLRIFDRILFVWLYRLWPGVLGSIVIVKPGTVVRWHRRGFRAYWRWKSRGTPGRPRIHGELLMVGVDVAKRARGAIDRINPTRVFGSRDRHWRSTFAPRSSGLCRLLQRYPHTPASKQRCATHSGDSTRRPDPIRLPPRRTASFIGPNLIFSEDRAIVCSGGSRLKPGCQANARVQ